MNNVQIVSSLQLRGNVSFPTFQCERHYMVPFTTAYDLPEQLSHFRDTVAQMLLGIPDHLRKFLMIDRSYVKAGECQRRPGLHIDGYWNAEVCDYSSHCGNRNDSGWDRIDFSAPEALLLASDVSACRAYTGVVEGVVAAGGDCSSVDASCLTEHRLLANRVYAGNVSLLHESLPVECDCQRTLVRINVAGWTP